MKGKGETIVHCGPPGLARNEDLFERALKDFEPLEIRTLYLTACRFRRDQLRRKFLGVHPAVFETPVLTLDDLTRALLRAAPIPAHRIGESEKLGLLEEILGAGRYRMGNPTYRAGALPHVSRYVAFVKGQNIFDAEMLLLRYRKFRRDPSPLEKELIEIFSEYQSTLERLGLEDREGERARLYTGLLTGMLDPLRVFPSLRSLFVEGFFRLSELEAGILNLLRERLDRMEVSVAGLEGSEWDPRRPEWRFLQGPEARMVVHPPPPPPARRRFVRPANREEEVWYAARRILRLKGESPGLDWSSIAIVSNQTAAYLPALDEIFGDFGIPFHPLAGRSARESAGAAALVKYLRMLEEDFSRESLFDFVSCSPLEFVDCSRRDLMALESLARRPAPPAGVDYWVDKFPELVKRRCRDMRRVKPELSRNLAKAAEILAGAVGELDLPLEPPRPLSRWRREVASRLIPYWPCGKIPARSARSDEDIPLRDFWLDLGAAALVQRSEGDCSFGDFKAFVQRQLTATRSFTETDGDAVVVATPRQIQQAGFTCLFWLGLAEGEYPENPTQHIFFDDVRSSQWGFFGWQDRLDESRWLFRLLTSSVSAELHLSCPLKIGEAQALPSSLLRELSPDGLEPVSPPEAFAALRLPLQPSVAENVQRGRRALKVREAGSASVFQGFFEDPRMLRLLRQSMFPGAVTVAPSHLESYVGCGFRFFLRKVLGLAPAERETAGLSPLERGNLIHRVLFRFMTEGFEPPSDPSWPARRDWTRRAGLRMQRVLREELTRLRPDDGAGQELFSVHEEELLASGLLDEDGRRGALAEFIDQQWERLQKCRIEALEAEMGPVELGSVPDPQSDRLVPVRLKGKIDRIDSFPEGLFLIDYKTGLQQHQRVNDGWGFQLPLYLWMVERWMGRPVRGAGFHTVRPPAEVRLRELMARDGGDPRRGLRRLVDYYRDKALKAVESLHRGRFPVTLLGREKAGCGSCGFRRVCRYDSVQAGKLREEGGFPLDEKIIERGRWLYGDDSPVAESNARRAH